MDVLPWDGTHIGDITNDIDIFKGEDANQSTLATYKDTTILVLKFKNNFPLIVDELKDVFGLTRMFYHRCTINNTEYIIGRQWNCNTTLQDYDKNENHYGEETPLFMLEIRRIYAFRAVFFLSFNNDNSVYVKPLGKSLYNTTIKRNTALPISRIENSYSIVKQSTQSPSNTSGGISKIIHTPKRHGLVPKRIIAKYFDNDEEMFYNEILKMRSEISAVDIKYKMLELIKKYEPDSYIDWVNAVALNWKV